MNLNKVFAVNRFRFKYAMNFFNMFGMPLLVAKAIQELMLDIGIDIPFILLFGVGLVAIIILGWIFDKMGFIREELSFQGRRNQELQDIKAMLKKDDNIRN